MAEPGDTTDRERRHLMRNGDGSLSDAHTGAAVSLKDLLDDVRGGRRFRAVDGRGADVTMSVLRDVILRFFGGAELSRALEPDDARPPIMRAFLGAVGGSGNGIRR